MKKIALSVLTSCLMIGTINTAYSAKEKMNVDLSYLDGVSKAQHYEDSVDIVNGGKRTIDCSNVVKRGFGSFLIMFFSGSPPPSSPPPFPDVLQDSVAINVFVV